MSTPEISVVIPAHNEAENIGELVREIGGVLAGRAFEIIVVDDGSNDRTAAMAGVLPGVRIASHARSLGQSAALWTGANVATADIIVTLDGDGQNDPRYIPDLLAPLSDRRIGLVAGRRLGRQGSMSKKVGSRIANSLRRALLADGSVDSACGAKAFRRDAFVRLPFFDALHRFLPALFLADGWRVVSVDVVDRARRHGRSHYGTWDRLAAGIPDLFGVWWLIRRRARNPLKKDFGPQ